MPLREAGVTPDEGKKPQKKRPLFAAAFLAA
jgi:hypothetical protein